MTDARPVLLISPPDHRSGILGGWFRFTLLHAAVGDPAAERTP